MDRAVGAGRLVFTVWTFLEAHVRVVEKLVTFFAERVCGAVVVVEAIYFRITRGADAATASVEALREVFAPVTASVLTTMAAFLPLMLLPGIVGKFMMVVPAVVTLALAFSLFEAYWMLPAHIMGLKLNFRKPSRVHKHRVRFTHKIRVKYSRALLFVMRRPTTFLVVAITAFALAVSAVAMGLVRIQFFAFDPMRLFYVNVDMPPGTALEETLARAVQVETKVRKHLSPEEARAITAVAGVKYTDTEPLYGNKYAQVVVSLNPREGELRTVDETIAAMRDDVASNNGNALVTFTRISGGPPLTKPISVKIRGDNFEELRKVTDHLANFLSTVAGVSDISDDDSPGRDQLTLRLNREALQQSGLNAANVARVVRLYVDGEIVTFMQDRGEKVEVRVRAEPETLGGIDQLLNQPVPLPEGGYVPLREIVTYETGPSKGSIRHYNFLRTITLEADIDRELLNEIQASNMVLAEWELIRSQFPDVTLDFSGALDDIQESLDAMLLLFAFGLGLIYLIIGTQFRSYLQPFMILVTVPLAFTGVVIGLLITGNPMSLYTIYGVVALTGIAVNSAIVLIDAANDRLRKGMSVLHAIVYAARRRVVPILITSFTTVAGLFSLATGLGGESLLWGPVASSIMWGLAVATVMTLFVIPLVYRAGMTRSQRRKASAG